MEQVIDEIYEAAVLPELWPATLASLSRDTGSAVGLVMSSTSQRDVSVISTPGSEDLLVEYQSLGLFERSERMPRLIGRPYAGFLSDTDLYTPQEQAEDPCYTEFLWPKGLGIGTATAIRLPQDETIIVDFERRRDLGPYEPAALRLLDALRPHLARACMLAVKTEQQRARGAVDALEAVGLAAAVLDRAGRLRVANAGMQELVPDVFRDMRERFQCLDPAADLLLATALQAGPHDACSRSIAIPAAASRPPMVAHVLPMRRAGLDLFAHAANLLVVTMVVPVPEPSADLVESLFDLTPAEANVARLIGGGLTIDEIAAQGGNSPATVRTQLRAVLAKTGTRRQSALVGLLGSIALRRG